MRAGYQDHCSLVWTAGLQAKDALLFILEQQFFPSAGSGSLMLHLRWITNQE
jgi:hypothetical protein